jgi:hypothetical protein
MTRRRSGHGRGVMWLALALGACGPLPRDVARPQAEFLVVSDDSTAWVRTSADTVLVQRAPMMLTTLDGRLVELYLSEESIDFDEASFLAARVFRRDIVSGDSALVFADSTVLRSLGAFLRANPSAERLPDDQPIAPDVRAVEASISPLGIVGSTLGLDVHVDRTVGELGTHDTYRATIDLATGRRLPLAAVVSNRAAADAIVAARQQLAAAVTLAGRRAGTVGVAASRALSALTLDTLSYSLVRRGDSLAAQFLAHDEQVIDEARDSHWYALTPLPLPSPTWWSAARGSLPEDQADSSMHFRVGSLRLAVRSDSSEISHVAAVTSGGLRSVLRMRGPVRRIIAINDSLIAPAGQWRRALQRAFSESGYTSDEVRAASLRVRARQTAARQAPL